MNISANPNKILHAATLLCCGCVLALFTQSANANGSSAEQLAAKYPNSVQYVIRRKGKKVGTHVVEFTRRNTQLNVDVESIITIRILKVPVFKFNYTASEQWKNGKLTTVKARTNNGGELTKADYKPIDNDTVAYSSNHWNSDVLDANEVFNTLTGKMSQVSIDKIGNELLQDDDISINADRYRYSGDIQADVWYDASDRWVKLEFKGEDGSVITYTADPLNFTP